MNITSCSVKVMRSFDYCHFEVVLGSVEDGTVLTVQDVDELRKEAARLADKSVEQYKVAKANAEKRQWEALDRHYLSQRMSQIAAMPEAGRTVEQQAELKAYHDAAWSASRRYDYEDEREDEEDFD